MGSGHELQVDGIGGGHPLTSKIAIVGRSARPDADVDYLFAQASVLEPAVDISPNCGNMLAGVGPFAIEAGMIPASAPETTVRIHNVNTGKLIEAVVQTPDGTVTYEGSTAIDGVPGTAAPIRLAFLDAAGSKTGHLLPTGQVRDRIQGIDATCIDMAMPLVIMRAADFGKTGHERPAEFDADTAFFARLEAIRREAGALMGLGDVSGMVIPKPVLVSAAGAGGTLTVRYFTPRACHRAVAATGAVGIATACVLPGSLAAEFAGPLPPGPTALITIEHPAGRIPIELDAGTGRCGVAGPARLARAHRAPAVCGLGVRSRFANLNPSGRLMMSTRRTILATACAAALVGATAGLLPATVARPGLSRPADPSGRALRRRRRHRRDRPRDRAGHDRAARPADRGREQRHGRRQRRDRAGGQGRSRRLHAADGQPGADDGQPASVQEREDRPADGVRPGDADRRGAAGRRRARRGRRSRASRRWSITPRAIRAA